nr:hypothetical protein [Candidatus Sigynarchaeota archaeon]
MTGSQCFDFTTFQESIFPAWEAQFKVGPRIGDYSFAKGGKVDSYGTTDLLIAKYIMNDIGTLTDAQKDEWARIINSFQDQATGKYVKAYTMHFWEHTTAYAVCALKLIDRKPAYPMAWKNDILRDRKSMTAWTRQWQRAPWSLIWPGSHIWSGVPAALAMTGEGTDEFFEWYFDWFDKAADPSSGYWRRGWLHKMKSLSKPVSHDLFGAFHMYYVYECMGRKWKYPEKVVDCTLRLQLDTGLWGQTPEFYCRDLDGLYALTRSSRNAGGYRADDVKAAVVKFLATAERTLNDRDFVLAHYPDTHHLAGALCAIAECQKFYPDIVKTARPWLMSIDKACYI